MANELSVDLVFKAKNAQQAARQGANEVNATLASQVNGLRPTSIEKEDAGGLIRSRKAAAAKRAENNRIEIAYEVEAASRRNRAAALLRQRQQTRDSESSEQKRKAALIGMAKVAVTATVVFLTLKKAISEMAESANRAAQTYAKILQSGGMAAGFVVKREQLAKIIGVSEDQVMQYGAAIGYLNSRLQWSTKIFTETNPTLTALSWNLKIVENDFAAMAAKITNAAAPAFNSFLKFLDAIIKRSGDVAGSVVNDAVKNQQIFNRALQFMDKISGKGDALYPNIDTKTGQISFASSAGKISEKAQTELQDQFKKFLSGHPLTDKVPQAPISLNRFPASSWQKMGLVIGGGGRSPQEKIAQNTSKAVTHLQQIVNLLQPRTGNARNPANILANPMYPQP